MKCVDATGRHFVVEIQVLKLEGFEKRVVYHARQAYVMQLRDATLRLLARRGLPIDDVAAARLAACAELGTLDRWFGSSVDALTIAEVFAS